MENIQTIKEILNHQSEYKDCKRVLTIIRHDKCKIGILPNNELRKFNLAKEGLLSSLLEEYYQYRKELEENK